MTAADGDRPSRARALDPARSFIVEAPAGSGKTELLIQRYLKLLDTVDTPEQVLAITFTRKAAAEMRQRVVAMLKLAGDVDRDEPAYRRATRDLAERVLARSARLSWSLLERPQRLRIMTIDAFNTGLAQHLPLLAGGVVGAGIAEKPASLYRAAARRTLGGLAEDSRLGRALRALLESADNSREQLEQWLADALAQRDRWLRFEIDAEDTWAGRIEDSLGALQQQRLAAVRELAGPDDERALAELVRHAAGHAPAGNDKLAAYASLDSDPKESAAAAPVWRGAAALLLTESRAWRRRFTRRDGLAPDDGLGRGLLERVESTLMQRPGMREALAAFAECPEPALTGEQKTRLEGLQSVLVRLLAELRVLFSERGTVDYTELALAAQSALGAVDAPSDLLLALDRRIEHVLIDEFQDTSHLQWRLLEHLTSGWTSGDGRTLFLVGDPMQSIYRFRDADLSLFLRAQRHGIGPVSLERIRLKDNHRSAPALVDWVNETFPRVFAGGQGPDAGQPDFQPAAARRQPGPGHQVAVHLLESDEPADETARVVAIVDQELERGPDQSIGILVRSRAHQTGLRAALKAAGLHAHATEIDSLTDTQLGQDLLGLTRALSHGADRIAWLALLRSPCCGLGWHDLHALCGDDLEAPLWELLQDNDRLGRLSESGRERAAWLADRLRIAFSIRAGHSFGRWVRECWYLIDGPAALADETELELAETYFRELDALARRGDLDDPAVLENHFTEPAAGADVPAETGVEIMTIHRAKGLGFDCVIVMGLGRAAPAPRSRLLLANGFWDPSGRHWPLLAANDRRHDPLYRFLARRERDQEAAERARLLYVAATRARERLYLVGSLDGGTRKPRRGSLLELLGPDFVARTEPEPRAPEREAREWIELPIERLQWDRPIPMPPLAGLAGAAPETAAAAGGEPETGAGLERPVPAARLERPDFEWVSPASVQVGTQIHRELKRLADAIARRPDDPKLVLDLERYSRELSLLGVEARDLPEAAERVAAALRRVWADPTGRWILKPRPEAWSELELTVKGAHGLEHLRLDRSFVDDRGRRWIIDYKTGRHLGGNVDAFLAAEVERYRGQLARYAEAVAAIDSRPLRVGLYFPLMTVLREVQPSLDYS